MLALKIKRPLQKKQSVKLSKERKLLLLKRLETRNPSTKTSKPNKKLKTKQPKRLKRRQEPLLTERND